MVQGPFGNTILPNPGGQDKTQLMSNNPPSFPVNNPPPVTTAHGDIYQVSQTSLPALAAPLLSLSFRLRNAIQYNDIDGLKKKLVSEIDKFQTRAPNVGLSSEQIRMASYILCTFLDEIIQNTPWGVQSNWFHQSLLIHFHHDNQGGERFFQVIDVIVKQPAQNLKDIEFCYVLLSFGFEGKYRLIAQGTNYLDKIRSDLYHLIQQIKGDTPPELSPRWIGQQNPNNTLTAQLPLWVFATVASGLLLFIYLGFTYFINSASDPAYKSLLMLSREPLVPVATGFPANVTLPEPVKKSLERFKPLLQQEIANNMVEVVDDSIIRIRNSFLSGSDQVKPDFMPMLKKIAKELQNQQDSILVTGHTDDKPIISAKFPSNWHLSVARAKNVLDILQTSGQLSGTARAEGRADGESLVANDSTEHRALNRRVDILVK